MSIVRIDAPDGPLGVSDWCMYSQTAEQLRSAGGRAKILIVSASAPQATELRSALGDFEHQLLFANSACEAVATMSRLRIDLILLNMAPRSLSSLDLCQVVKKSPATRLIPVFVIGVENEMDVEVSALEAGADEFVMRPLRAPAFRARVQANLRHKAMLDSLDDSETVLFSLAQSVEERAHELGQHCNRLALMGAAMGLAMGLPSQDILALQRGGYLHDIGKIGVPDNILFKPGPLNEAEWDVMKQHPERGERICSGIKSLASVLPIIRHHHERWDGSGYPDGLKGEQIPLLARIMQLADIYYALTTSRPYKSAMSPEQALSTIQEEANKGWRDPKLVSLFEDVLPMFRSVPAGGDLSRLSLHALASYIERFRRDSTGSSKSGHRDAPWSDLKLASGF